MPFYIHFSGAPNRRLTRFMSRYGHITRRVDRSITVASWGVVNTQEGKGKGLGLGLAAQNRDVSPGTAIMVVLLCKVKAENLVITFYLASPTSCSDRHG